MNFEALELALKNHEVKILSVINTKDYYWKYIEIEYQFLFGEITQENIFTGDFIERIEMINKIKIRENSNIKYQIENQILKLKN